MKSKVLVIVGPTASGKSDLAVKLAKKFKGEIISADSRQVYKGLDIGTGKITKKEMRGIPHHLLDVANPKERFSASDFIKKAQQAITTIHRGGHIPIVVGGTGFYIDTLSGVVTIPNVPPNKKLRAKLGKKSNATLFKLLRKKDLKRARTIDNSNKVRLIRALEIVETLGKVPPRQPVTSTQRFIYVGLKPSDLDKRIHKRLLDRIDGIIIEAKRLKQNGLSYKRMYELGLEYRYVALHLQKKISKEEMIGKLNTAIRQYAKRQMTWFKRNKKIKWFKSEEYKEIEKYALNMLR
ncbi:MAG: tRNA (adenosine(37)-N6)-dimethylallyltransferase MiaA [Candidatus Zambryskibacteria bacterium]|nr:tRNA (adenosine(37)-N6)-dimethylallyltransferase MiaA [Candidatus Zambryskibacteria bacterium]